MSNADIVKPLSMTNGNYYVVEFSATGGVKYGRVGEGWEEEKADESLEAEYTTRKMVDHIGLLKWSRKIVNAAYNVMERHGSPTPIGYFVAKTGVEAMLAELAGVKREAQSFNKAATDLKSARRCRIDIYAVKGAEECDESLAIRLAETVRERLTSLREDLCNGDLNAYATSWKRAKNLPKLATGIQAESIVLALEAARECRSKLAEAIKNKTEPKRAGEALDFTTIDSAIWLFTDSVNGTLAVVEDPAVDAA